MNYTFLIRLHWLTATILVCVTSSIAAADSDSAQRKNNVWPASIGGILKAKCSACHSGVEAEARLDVGSLSLLMAGGEGGAAITPGKPKESLLWIKIESNTMPPKGQQQLTLIEKQKILRWIQTGRFPSEKDVQQIKRRRLRADANQHWAFRPVTKPVIPVVKNRKWPHSEMDSFVLSRLQTAGIEPVGDANPYTLLRRLYYDLTGLPPSERAIHRFLRAIEQSDFQRAVEKVVDRLLKSVAFGELWGRHWLDVARYSDTLGGGQNFTLNDAWRYRDYVINSFHNDKPYHRFLTEQIAGDLMPYTSAKQHEEQLVATGFLAVGLKDFTNQDKVKVLADSIDEQMDTLGKAFMGMTIGCARCHNHKFDPIPIEDYYALAGIFRSTQTLKKLDDTQMFSNTPQWNLISLPTMSDQERDVFRKNGQRKNELLRKEADQLKAKISKLQARTAAVENGQKQSVVAGQLAELQKRATDVRAALRFRSYYKGYDGTVPSILGVLESATPADSRINVGGNPRQLGSSVPRGVLRAIGDFCAEISDSQSGRLQLAEWLASPRNPLTARVMANRIWTHLIGRGIVETVDNFGTRGSRPTHPELLDYLAIRFVEEGWSVKKLIRRIVLSRVYQLASERNPSAVRIDPDNKLLWKRATRRLDAEALRDSLLTLGGELDGRRGGPTLVHAGIMSIDFGLLKPIHRNGLWNRRSVYLPVYRGTLIENEAMMSTFDFADPNFVVGHRTTSIVPTQALFLMNNDLTLRCAESLARKLLKDRRSNAARVRALYLSVFGRPVQKGELERALKFIESSITQLKDSETSEQAQKIAWTGFAQVMFSSSEFLFVN